MKVAVTGGFGFIGSNLVKTLVSTGYELVVFDNLSTGDYRFLSDNEKSQITFVQIDLAKAEVADIKANLMNTTTIFHLAANADVRGGWNEYATRVNRELMAIALLEEKESIADLDALAAMPGLDAFFVGPTDLSVSLGVPGATFDDPKMSAALDTVVATTRRHGKHAMTLIGNNLNVEYGRAIAKRGVQIIVLGTDGDLFVDAIKRMAGVKA